MIGIANLHKRLYVINTVNIRFSHSVCNYVSNANSTLWYYSLGHTSHIGLRAISKSFPFISTKNSWSHCDSFHYAKQNKLPFPLNNYISFAHFELLHGDL